MPYGTGYNRDASGRLVTASAGTIAGIRHGLAKLADGTTLISVAAPVGNSNGFPVDAGNRVAVTTSTVGATRSSGFLRAPNGALVVSVTATKWETGYMRGPNGELTVTATA